MKGPKIFREIEKVYFCAGGRNAALLDFFKRKLKKCRIEFYLDERMASFIALGEAKRGRLVAICTTSGTAVLETLSALAEGYYSNVNLVLITGDRPKSLRFTGAPQTIDQLTSMTPFVHSQLDLSTGFDLEKLTALELAEGITHINIQRENKKKNRQKSKVNSGREEATLQSSPIAILKNKTITPSSQSERELMRGKFKTKEFKQPLYLIAGGYIYDEVFCDYISKNADFYFFELLSNFSHKNKIKYEKELIRLYSKGTFDCIIRIGHTPVSKLWRLLDDNKNLYVLNIDPRGLSALSYGDTLTCNYKDMVSFIKSISSGGREKKLLDKEIIQGEQNFRAESQYAYIELLSKMLTNNSHLYIGNSGLIRDFEVAYKKCAFFYGNRGVNGIDGQLASSIGIAKNLDNHLYVALGDLTLEYDMSSLSHMTNNMTLLIFNNHGGRIFERIDAPQEIIMAHQRSYEALVKGAGLSYKKFNYKEFNEFSTSNNELKSLAQVIELDINEAQTLNDFKEL